MNKGGSYHYDLPRLKHNIPGSLRFFSLSQLEKWKSVKGFEIQLHVHEFNISK